MSDSLLPPNATAMEKALEQVTRADMSSPIRDLWNPRTCPESLLYVLALTMDVDVWDDNWPRAAKEQTIIDAYNVHRLRGTPSSIRRILRNAGYEEVDILEGLGGKFYDGKQTYNGHIYYNWDEAWAMYRIYLKRAITNEQAEQVKMLLDMTAPLHCILKGLHFTEALFTYNGEIRYDGQYNFGVA
ncbi:MULTISPECIES: phage tail protein I [unclassified Vibrio]|uniref:phage tail protein I n=1 Tax=unclassified Vibrio TaxID=2614977 RepID=UPI001360F71B|nr:phage tail protein I [Vibrio sp. V36_P2S2PM302]NAX21008.1 phage tail protein I [Vibrio sp. V39_P1S14PM300]NAX27639.1 phage tail protein I [Vibrio sp. V38_P2S17PM301]NAX29391.1 phage tail protein I [Vibrio sp. V37_P2S8PM304]